MPVPAKPKPELLWSVWIFRARSKHGHYFIEWPFVHNHGATLIEALGRAAELFPGCCYPGGAPRPGVSIELHADTLDHDEAMAIYAALPHTRRMGGDFGNQAVPPRQRRSVAA